MLRMSRRSFRFKSAVVDLLFILRLLPSCMGRTNLRSDALREEVLAFMIAVELASIHWLAFSPLSIPYCPVDSGQRCLKDVGIQTVGNGINVRVRNERSILA
jgi:hypothetical protein